MKIKKILEFYYFLFKEVFIFSFLSAYIVNEKEKENVDAPKNMYISNIFFWFYLEKQRRRFSFVR